MALSIVSGTFHVLGRQTPYQKLAAAYFDRLNAEALKRPHPRRLGEFGVASAAQPLPAA